MAKTQALTSIIISFSIKGEAMNKPDITCVIITLNEEPNIARAILSAKPVSKEILVVDSGSTDQTVTVAENLGARSLFREFTNYAEQRNFGLSHVKTEWVLFLDADEELSKCLQEEILACFTNGAVNCNGFLIPRKNWYLGDFLRCWAPDRLLRLFKTEKGRWTGMVHEKVELKGRVCTMRNPILHYPFRDLYHQYSKNLKYAQMLAQEKDKKGEKFRLFDITLRPILNFLKHYVFKGCIFDGIRGLIFSLFYLQYTIQKYSLLFERKQITKKNFREN